MWHQCHIQSGEEIADVLCVVCSGIVMQKGPLSLSEYLCASASKCLDHPLNHAQVCCSGYSHPVWNEFKMHQSITIKKSHQHDLWSALLDPWDLRILLIVDRIRAMLCSVACFADPRCKTKLHLLPLHARHCHTLTSAPRLLWNTPLCEVFEQESRGVAPNVHFSS